MRGFTFVMHYHNRKFPAWQGFHCECGAKNIHRHAERRLKA